MSTGDQTDFQNRIKNLLPQGWFPPSGETDTSSPSPVLDSVLAGPAAQLAAIWTQQQYVAAQTRIQTATGSNLDIIALDYLGPSFIRKPADTDLTFRARIEAQLLAPRNTRAAVIQAVTALTGSAPTIIEPSYIPDVGAYDVGTLAWDTAGYWGADDLPFQFFVQVAQPVLSGVPNINGWDVGGWDTGLMVWVDDSILSGQITDADIYATVANVIPAGTIAWVAIGGVTPPAVLGRYTDALLTVGAI